ncbi:MAG TPA: SGNH family hydrolase [Methylovirgula sp.]|nr:SGNH family hydrolase [Methylovirgula sp.]
MEQKAHTGRIWRGIRLLAAIALCLSLGTGSARAQGLNPFNWFQQMFQPPSYSYRYYEPPPRPHYRVPRSKPVEQTQKIETKPSVPPTFFVAVLGDSLGQLLGQGLTESLSDRPEVGVLRDARDDSGLVRDDFYDWTKAAHDLVTSGQKINVAVILIGSNDHQPLHDASGTYDPGTPKWQEIYAARVEAIAAIFHDAKIPLIWVGLPIMKSDRFSTEMAALNDIYRERASKNGATYVDIWQAFGDDRGQYSPYGPDVNGQVVRLRALDGVHFTKAGAVKLASFVAPNIRQILDAGKPQGDAALAKIETTTPAGTNAAVTAPAPKPPIGPVLPLTGPVLAPGAQLATPAASRTGEAQSLIEQTFASGKPPEPKPGRADDFSWPRQ